MTTIIIGAGPAGLTAALELLRSGKGPVVVLEATHDIGGISKTVNRNGNRIDIGGHRFFSKSDWVMNWWRDILPVARHSEGEAVAIAYQGKQRLLGAGDMTASEDDERVMLVRNRLSRIYFRGQFFDYPLRPNVQTAMKLGSWACMSFGASYAWSQCFPRRPEASLEDFFINRFGARLYRQFFKEYTEKVWGVACNEISPEWGAQRVKGLSVGSALKNAFVRMLGRAPSEVQTSLIEHFLYPKLGPGQLWEVVAEKVQSLGGRIIKGAEVVRLGRDGDRIRSVTCRLDEGHEQTFTAKHVVSTMPIRELVAAITPQLPSKLCDIAQGLQYRDFITVGVLYRKLRRTSAAIHPRTNLVPDNWIYIQEPGVKVGRLQVFNNWSRHMVRDPETVWVGLEFFAKEDDELWSMSDDRLKSLALSEMRQLNLADEADALDAVVIRMPKAYPGYYGSAYAELGAVKDYLDGIRNLFLVGRNGMHRYNNQDHSMLSARYAVEAIISGSPDKSAIWGVNIDDDYHEEVDSGGRAEPRPDATMSASA